VVLYARGRALFELESSENYLEGRSRFWIRIGCIDGSSGALAKADVFQFFDRLFAKGRRKKYQASYAGFRSVGS
jgi:hypothetical protein